MIQVLIQAKKMMQLLVQAKKLTLVLFQAKKKMQESGDTKTPSVSTLISSLTIHWVIGLLPHLICNNSK